MIGKVYAWRNAYWRVVVQWRWPRGKQRVCTRCGLRVTMKAQCDCAASHHEIRGTMRNVLIERVEQPSHFREEWVPVDPPERVVRPARGLRAVR